MLPVWVDNWVRLGLIEVDYTRHLVSDERYLWAEERPELERLGRSDTRGKGAFTLGKGMVRTTDFGKRFLVAVSYDGIKLQGAPGVRSASGEEEDREPAPEGTPGA